MRYHLRLPSLAVAAVVLFSACSPSGATTAPSAAAPSAAAPSAALRPHAPSGPPAAPAPTGLGVDDGTKLTLWTRAATEARARAARRRLQRVAREPDRADRRPDRRLRGQGRRGGRLDGLPDLFSADVVFMPNWTSAGPVHRHHRAGSTALPYRGQDRARRTSTASTWDGKKYGLPFVIDLSVLDVQQGALHARPGSTPRSRRRRSQSSRTDARARRRSSAATSTARSSAATAAAATSSPGGRSPGPTASRS